MMPLSKTIDLNCDLGEDPTPEGMARDAAIMGIVTSVNIACGVHAGDEPTMRATIRAAMKAGVAIGAHPGLPDRMGMGRVARNISAQEAYDLVFDQVAPLRALAQELGANLTHVKPHGALYNAAAQDSELATAIARAVQTIDPRLRLFGLANSESIRAGDALGLRTVAEGFVDRAYRLDGSLVPRDQPGAVLEETEAVVAQAQLLAGEGKVRTIAGELIPMPVKTLCLHGDTPNALAMAHAVRVALEEGGIEVRAIK